MILTKKNERQRVAPHCLQVILRFSQMRLGLRDSPTSEESILQRLFCRKGLR